MNLKLISSTNLKLECKSIPAEDMIKSKKLGMKMLEFLLQFKHGMGLSANQIGILKRIFVINYLGTKLIVINPKIIKQSFFKNLFAKKTKEWEGCLSYPGKYKKVKRLENITVEYHNGKNIVKQQLTETLARIFQHEYDHLNGKCRVK